MINFYWPGFDSGKWSALKPIWVSVGMAALCFITALAYGVMNTSNPFYVLMIFFQIQASLLLFMRLCEIGEYVEVKKAAMLGPVRLLTIPAIIAWTMPQQTFLMLLIPVAVICLLMAGGKDGFTVCRFFLDKHHDSTAFKKTMKEFAETARIEEALSLDLERFLTGADSAGKQKQ